MYTCGNCVSNNTSGVHRVHRVREAGSRQVVTRCTVHRVRVRADVWVLYLLMTIDAIS